MQKTIFRQVTSWDNASALLSINEASNLLQVPEPTIRHWCRTGQVPASRIGNLWRIDKRKLMEMFGYET